MDCIYGVRRHVQTLALHVGNAELDAMENGDLLECEIDARGSAFTLSRSKLRMCNGDHKTGERVAEIRRAVQSNNVVEVYVSDRGMACHLHSWERLRNVQAWATCKSAECQRA